MKLYMNKFSIKKYFVLILGVVFFSISSEVMAASPAFSFLNAEVGSGSRLFYDDVKPGETINGAFNFSLLENIPTVFNISFNDRASNILRKLNYDEKIEDSFFLSNWISFPKKPPIFVDGFGSVLVPFSIKVPEDALPGDYSGMFVAAIQSYGEKALKEKEVLLNPEGGETDETTRSGTRVSVGVAIEMVLRVAGEIVPSLEFNNVSYYEDKGSQKFVLDLNYENKGNVAVVPRANVLIKNIWGRELYSGSFRFSVLNSYMDGNSKVKINSKDFDFKSGFYTVQVDLFYDVFSRDLGENLVYVSGVANMKILYLEWYYFVLISVLILPILFYFVFKNLRIYFLLRKSKVYIVKDNETLQTISNKYSVRANHLILVNKLKAPYFINKGDRLLIPINKKK